MSKKSSNTENSRVVDMTPTWVSVLPLYLECYSQGPDNAAYESSKKEIYRIAGLADKYADLTRQVLVIESQLEPKTMAYITATQISDFAGYKVLYAGDQEGAEQFVKNLKQ